jgi:hypothetical protein
MFTPRRIAAVLAAPLTIITMAIVPATSAQAMASTADTLFGQLAVSAPVTAGYDRDLFAHWNDADGDGCDTRSEVLQTESIAPVTFISGCTVATGSWTSPYDGATWTNASDVDIDHMVPLGEAWASGADVWTADQRQAYANDLDLPNALIAVTDSVNQSKGNRDPAVWLPPATSYACAYVIDWITIKYKWSLTIDSAEQMKLSSILATDNCGGVAVDAPAKQEVGGGTAVPLAAEGATAVYRFWSPKFNGHFFTTSVSERNDVITRYPGIWNYEGVKYGAYTSQVNGTVPLYRFWSPVYNGHFFTTDAAERDQVLARYPNVWSYEGVAYYVYPNDANISDANAVNRFWSPVYSHHFYTASADEAANVKALYPTIWSYEGQSFQVPSALPAESQPVPTPSAPAPAPAPAPVPPANVYYANCDAVRAAGHAPLYRGQPGYRSALDRDGDGVACE